MNEIYDGFWLLLPILLSGAAGIGLLFSSLFSHIRMRADGAGEKLHVLVGAVLVLSVLLTFAAVWPGERSLTLCYLMDDIPVYFHVDALARLFAVITCVIWLITGIYAFLYMKHEGEEKRFFGFYLLVYSVLLSLDFAGNLVTWYFFYE